MNDADDELVSLYLWSFMEVHAWKNKGGSEGEPWACFDSHIRRLLLNDNKAVLSLVMPPQNVAEKGIEKSTHSGVSIGKIGANSTIEDPLANSLPSIEEERHLLNKESPKFASSEVNAAAKVLDGIQVTCETISALAMHISQVGLAIECGAHDLEVGLSVLQKAVDELAQESNRQKHLLEAWRAFVTSVTADMARLLKCTVEDNISLPNSVGKEFFTAAFSKLIVIDAVLVATRSLNLLRDEAAELNIPLDFRDRPILMTELSLWISISSEALQKQLAVVKEKVQREDRLRAYLSQRTEDIAWRVSDDCFDRGTFKTLYDVLPETGMASRLRPVCLRFMFESPDDHSVRDFLNAVETSPTQNALRRLTDLALLSQEQIDILYERYKPLRPWLSLLLLMRLYAPRSLESPIDLWYWKPLMSYSVHTPLEYDAPWMGDVYNLFASLHDLADEKGVTTLVELRGVLREGRASKRALMTQEESLRDHVNATCMAAPGAEGNYRHILTSAYEELIRPLHPAIKRKDAIQLRASVAELKNRDLRAVFNKASSDLMRVRHTDSQYIKKLSLYVDDCIDVLEQWTNHLLMLERSSQDAEELNAALDAIKRALATHDVPFLRALLSWVALVTGDETITQEPEVFPPGLPADVLQMTCTLTLSCDTPRSLLSQLQMHNATWNDYITDLLAVWCGTASSEQAVKWLADQELWEVASKYISMLGERSGDISVFLRENIHRGYETVSVLCKSRLEEVRENLIGLPVETVSEWQPWLVDVERDISEGNLGQAFQLLEGVEAGLIEERESAVEAEKKGRILNDIRSLDPTYCMTNLSVAALLSERERLYGLAEPRRKHVQTLKRFQCLTQGRTYLQSALDRCIVKLQPIDSLPSVEVSEELDLALQCTYDALEGGGMRLANIDASARLKLEETAFSLLSSLAEQWEPGRIQELSSRIYRFANETPTLDSPEALDHAHYALIEHDLYVQCPEIASQFHETPKQDTAKAQVNAQGIRGMMLASASPTVQIRVGDLVRDIRARLEDYRAQHPCDDLVGNRENLRSAARRQDWRQVLTEALRVLSLGRDDMPIEYLTDVEALQSLSMALLGSALELSGTLRCAVLAIESAATHNSSVSDYYLNDRVCIDTLLISGLLSLEKNSQLREYNDNDKPVLQRDFADCIKRMNRETHVNSLWQYLDALFRDAAAIRTNDKKIPASAILGGRFWDVFTGYADNAGARAGVLHLLYTTGQNEALFALAQRYIPECADLARGIVEGFQRAGDDSEMRSRALNMASAARRSLDKAKRANTSPWQRFFQLLVDADVRRNRSQKLTCSLLSDEFIEEKGCGSIEIALAFSSWDPPLAVALSVFDCRGQEANCDLPATVLLGNLPLTVKLPAIDFSREGEFVRIPFRIRVQSSEGLQYEHRDTWNLMSASRGPAIDEQLIEDSFPYHAGGPVLDEKHFFGREALCHELDRLLKHGDRPLSLLLVGRRRIGKTSLLLKMVDSMPPDPSRVVGVFVDVSGVTTSEKSLPTTFIETVVTYIKRNKLLLNSFSDVKTIEKDFNSFLRTCDAESGLDIALEKLIDFLNGHTETPINRLVLFVDEFDRFVAPLLYDDKQAVTTFLWSIRKVIQQSRRVGLVLAGSGLMQLYKSTPEMALSGSLLEKHLTPFSWPSEEVAVNDVFMPTRLRGMVCARDRAQSLAEHAYILCGGHPWYLAMLGYCAAKYLKGRKLSSLLLRRIAELMMEGSIDTSINARNFYYHTIFAELEKLRRISADGRTDTRRDALARIMLAYIAERTTIDIPELLVRDVLGMSELQKVVTSDEQRAALKDLESVEAIRWDRTNATIRIATPIEHLALYEHARRIRVDALSELYNRS